MKGDGQVRRHTVSLAGAAANALENEAHKSGIPVTDYLAMVLEDRAAELLTERDAAAARRLRAANNIKMLVAGISRELAREHGVSPDHTLRVFQTVRARHADLYRCATACQTGYESGIPEKHALNLALGAISKRAAGARVRVRPNGLPEKIRNITGEFCSSVTVLESAGEPAASEAPEMLNENVLQASRAAVKHFRLVDLPMHDTPWDGTVSLHREHMYGDDGR